MNNFYEIPNDWYGDFNGTFISNMCINNGLVNDIVSDKIGFERGNLFNSLYSPYKNYRYRNLKANNRKGELLLDILKFNFALVDMDLYLDTNPSDVSMLNLYNKYVREKEEKVNEYEKNFGPLMVDSYMGNNKFNWINSPWSWEGNR